jgi:hypothetical protein
MKKMTDTNSGNLLLRWSRRKLLAALEAEANVARPADTVREPAHGEEGEAEEELRRLALRALFRKPEFAVRDGLDDYDGDYTFFEARGEMPTQDILRALERAQKLPASALAEAADMENRLADQVDTAHPTETDMNTAGENSVPESGA